MSAERPIPYRKFSPLRWLIVGGERLWIGEDHLLLVRSTFGNEKYRRFYFQDIEALVIRPTTTQRGWIIANAICLAIFSSLTVLVLTGQTTDDEVAGGVVLAFIAACFLAALIYHVLRGATCACFLQLRTGLERLAVANRFRAAQRMRDRLIALIGSVSEAKTVAPLTP